MSHTISYDPESNMVETKIQGTLTSLDLHRLISEILQMAKANDCHYVLNDFRDAKENLSTIEIYELPKIISDIASSMGLEISQFQRAAIVLRDYEDFSFFENVTSNLGQTMRVFKDPDEAKKWLSEKKR
jgi:hypothetical protein